MKFGISKPTIFAGVASAAAALSLITSPVMAASSSGLVLEVDTVSTHGCVQTNVFQRGTDAIVWRVAALQNGKEDKKAKVVVHVLHGPTLTAGWDASDGFFTAAWFLPFDAHTGTVSYTVTATDGSLSARYSPPFMVAPSELMIIPYTYEVTVAVGNGSKSVSSFGAKASIPVKVNVTWTTVKNNKATLHPMTSGRVTAAIGLEGNVNGQGNLNAVKSVALKYNASSKTWTGNISTSGIKAGLYVVQASVKDDMSPANTGSGLSLAFNVR